MASLRNALAELLQSAEYIQDKHGHEISGTFKLDADIRRAREALAQEPIAWLHQHGEFIEPSARQLDDDERARGWVQAPLYR